ncbi:MAG: fibrobacter succinogenes major paralogous domain-containing protein [Cryomorphaceae bacterium]|nr:fibrobacter succinogenes major paralogous domain-containing protein [Cryomorphaceae bacterium]
MKNPLSRLLIVIFITTSAIVNAQDWARPGTTWDVTTGIPIETTPKPMNQFAEVTIGHQVWMTKNLDVDKFRNGDPIPQAKTIEEWKTADYSKKPAWCFYNNDPANGAKYGKLYNWYAVNDPRGLAPVGYHVPSNAEWETLKNYLGNKAEYGLKSSSGWHFWQTGGSKTCPNCKDWNAEYRKKVPCHTCKDTRSLPAPWVTHSGNGTNSSGFSGLPGGYRSHNGDDYSISSYGAWWSSDSETWRAYAHSLQNFSYGLGYGLSDKADGLSVRCLRD